MPRPPRVSEHALGIKGSVYSKLLHRLLTHEGEVYPCGYLPAIAGDLRKQKFADIWANAAVFNELRDTDNLKGKCGCCEFRNVCMGCRARAFAATGDYLDEEPFCVYEPKSPHLREKVAQRTS